MELVCLLLLWLMGLAKGMRRRGPGGNWFSCFRSPYKSDPGTGKGKIIEVALGTTDEETAKEVLESLQRHMKAVHKAEVFDINAMVDDIQEGKICSAISILMFNGCEKKQIQKVLNEFGDFRI